MRRLVPVLVLSAVLASPSRADAGPACDIEAAEARITQIHQFLRAEGRRARIWNTAWAIGFFVVTPPQFIFGAKPDWTPLIEVTEAKQAGLVIGGIKSGLASLARIIVPLKLPSFDSTTDTCATLAEAERALALAGKKEKRTFWLNMTGATIANTGGALIIGLSYDSWTDALISLAIGLPVTAAQMWTQPRGAWRSPPRPGARTESSAFEWQIVPMATRRSLGAGIVGRF